MVHQRRDDDDGGDKDDRPGHHHDDNKVDKDLGTCHSRRQMRPLKHCVWPFYCFDVYRTLMFLIVGDATKHGDENTSEK